jgi:hypothetical protein
MIVMQGGYSQRPQFKGIQTVVNFDAPTKYNSYKENGSNVESENGCELTLVDPAQES